MNAKTLRPGSPRISDAAPSAHTPPAIPRRLVHKAARDEVLLSGWRETGEDSFVTGAQWPRDHDFYVSDHGLYDPMLVVETFRQSIPLLCHVGYDAPLDNRQTWDRFRCTLFPEALRQDALPTTPEIHLTCADVVRRAGRLTGMTMRATAVRDGRRLGLAETRFTNQAPAIYRRLRGARSDAAAVMARAVAPPAPLAPGHVGQRSPRNVVLAPGTSDRHWQLRVDVHHPVLFDHPVDHAPGMLLLEAARQAAHHVLRPARPVMTGLDVQFFRFVELDETCWIEAEPALDTPLGHRTVRVTGRQAGQTAFTATVTMTLLD
ncbi:ScbA/BarX family gamma-butyrolactone biosynthesis protein [Streptomyces sp. NPDC004284]|uniref:ScbA/BarX family gamma-butyrolactone biosynthesis protein n=1 Tax=Streptomyces sp. NPDC004284 TaxID=3364695 RepID=UPI0036A3BE21